MESIRQKIVDASVTMLGALAIADGYNFEWRMGGGAQPRRVVNCYSDLPTVIIEQAAEEKDRESNSRFLGNTCTLTCIGYPLIDMKDLNLEIDRELDRVAYDIERAFLKTSLVDDPPLGVVGVTQVYVRGHIKAGIEDRLAAVVTVDVQYRHDRGEPGSYSTSG